MRKIAVLFTLMFGLNLLLFSQPPIGVVQAEAYAVVVTPNILLVENDILHFGEVMPGLQSGDVILSPDNMKTLLGGVYATTNIATTNAIFRVVGVPNTEFNITLPNSTTLTGSNGGTMTVDTYTTNIVGNAGVIDSGGTQFSVGATLRVGNIATQEKGTYVGTFDVVVNKD